MRGVSLERFRDVVRSAFWLVPSLCTIGAVGLALALVEADQWVGQFELEFLFPGPPNGARTFLSAIIQAMIAFTALVFSITIVVLQLTSSQFSPRVLRSYLQDRTIQLALGIFVATFVYGLVVLRAVRGGEGDGTGAEQFVPRLAVTGTFVLMLISVGLFIRYISHMVHMIRVASILDSIGEDARRLLERRHPRDAAAPVAASPLPPPRRTVPAPRAGVLVSVNEEAIVETAAAADGIVVLVPRVGDYVPEGAPLLRLHGEGEIADAELTGRLSFDIERTLQQDVPFAFRQLVDIAQKALSPGINDPTTAAQAVDIAHDLLRRLATRRLVTGRHCDRDGTLRLVVEEWTFPELLDLVVGQIWHYGADAAEVPGRLSRMLEDLGDVASPDDRAAIARWRRTVAGHAAAS